jgi:large-conductance mechanosensitive channel
MDFLSYLREKDIYSLLISLVISKSVSNLVETMIEQLVKPMTKNLNVDSITGDDGLEISYFGQKLELYKLINQVLEFLFVMFLVYMIFKLTQ